MKLRRSFGRRHKIHALYLKWVPICVAVVSLMASPASAVDLRVLADVVERIEFDDNLRVEPDSDGNVYGSTTTMDLDVTARTPRSTLNVRGGANLRRFGGPGATSDLDTFDQNVKGDLEFRGPTTTLGVNGSFARQNTAFTEFEDVFVDGIDQTTVNDDVTDRLSHSVGGDITINVNRTDKVSASVTYRGVDFTDNVDGLVPSDTILVSASWFREVTEQTDVKLSGSVRFFDADNPEQRESNSAAFSGRLTREVTPRLEVYGEAGVSIVDTEELIAGVRQSDTTVDGNFDFGLTYLLCLTTTFSASVSQSVTPSDVGELRQSTRVNADVVHLINTISSFSAGAAYVFDDSTSSSVAAEGDRMFARFYARYSVQLAPYWHFALGYEFRFVDDDDGNGTSNKVFGTLSREFVLLP